MCKKLGMLAAVAVVGTLVVSQTRLGSYVGTAWDRAKARAHKQVSPEFQLERARHLAGQLGEDIEKQKGVVADETVRFNDLNKQVATARKNFDQKRDELAKLRSDVDSGVTKVKVDGTRTLTPEEAKDRLNRDYKTWTLMEDELKSREKLVSVQERKKALAEQQLTTLFAKKRELEARIAQAEARLQELKLQQAENNSARGEDTLAEVNELLGDIERDLDREKVKSELDKQYGTGSKPAEPTVSDEEMRERLGVTKPNKVVRGDE